jgi:glyoxylase-like metal-dependent hydrolase (beta-lactamase superfamily II)
VKVTDSVYQASEVMGGPAIILGEGYVTLVDAGIPGSEDAIFATIREAGREPAELKHVLVTHSDYDHIGSLPKIVEETGAKVYAEATHAAVMRGEQPARGGSIVEPVTGVNEVVADGDVIPIHGGVQVVSSPGHCVGHVSFLVLEGRVLIVGDAVSNTNGLGRPAPQYTDDMPEGIRSVGKLAALAPETLVFGHGEPIVGGAAPRLQALADELATELDG